MGITLCAAAGDFVAIAVVAVATVVVAVVVAATVAVVVVDAFYFTPGRSRMKMGRREGRA